MEELIWNLRTLGGLTIAAPVFHMLWVLLLLCWEYPLLLPYCLAVRAASGEPPGRRDPSARALPVLLVIPSLLRVRDELTSMMSTIASCAENGYPGELTIVISIDGTNDAPPLYAELCEWARRQFWDDGHVLLFITGTPERRSKPMAIDHALEFTKGLVADGFLSEFPPIYVSTDADADLDPGSLERIVYRLQRRNRFTGWPARIVAGALHVRGDSYWRGLRRFFTMEGQLNLQVAREYYVSNVARYNVRWLPVTGVPGAFYCTWSEIYLAIPRFMGYTRGLRLRHFLGWWVGIAPPKFSETTALPFPERVAGDTDDTVTAYVATLARYRDGRLTFDPPRTPLHALLYLVQGLLIDRPIQYEPWAHVYTSSPTTVRALFKQRKRWNSARVELSMRFFRVLGYHWILGLPVSIVKVFLSKSVIVGVFAYIFVPAFLWNSHFLTAFIIGLFVNFVGHGMLTCLALLMKQEWKHWRLLLAVPLAPIYVFCFNWIPGATGVICDVLLFGNVTGFAPESTLIRGRSVRIALLFRLRRAWLLLLRSILCGDVPLGRFWFGWHETPWTPNGYEGWTTRQKPRSILPPRSAWFRRSRAHANVQPSR
jgi:hypothetical protein